jgi:peptidyl-tRNA hydrolase
MEDHDSPEAVAKRAAQEDPIVMYLIVRTSLEMSVGKTVAQGGHAVGMLQLKFDEIEDRLEELEEIQSTFVTLNNSERAEWDQKHPVFYIYKEWLDTSYRKVVLACKDKDWEKVKAACPNHTLVIDAGLTEIASGSETVLGLWPMRRSACPKIITKLQVLK